jgi:hypothetical protein
MHDATENDHTSSNIGERLGDFAARPSGAERGCAHERHGDVVGGLRCTLGYEGVISPSA